MSTFKRKQQESQAQLSELKNKFSGSKKMRTIKGHREGSAVHAIQWNSQGRLASGSTDHTVRIWNVELEKCDLELRGHEKPVESLSFDPADPQKIVSASGDTARIWDLRLSRCVHKISTSGDIFSVAWQPHGDLIAIVDKSKTLSLFDHRLGKKRFVQTLEGAVNDLKWDTTGKLIATPGIGNISLQRMKVEESKTVAAPLASSSLVAPSASLVAPSASLVAPSVASTSLVAPSLVVPSVASTSLVASASILGSASILSPAAQVPAAPVSLSSSSSSSSVPVSLSSSAPVSIATPAHILAPALAHKANGSLPVVAEASYVLQAHTSTVYCVDFDPTGNYFAAGSADSLVSIWSLPEFICLRSLSKLEQSVRVLSFSFDGKLIAHGYEGQEIDISFVANGKQVQEIQAEKRVQSLSWHPSQYVLAYAGDEPNVHICSFSTA